MRVVINTKEGLLHPVVVSVRLTEVKAKQSAAKKTTGIDDVERSLLALEAKKQFLSASMSMGWRLAVTVVIPIVAGVKLDERFNSRPSLTLAGLMLAAIAGCAAVWSSVKEVNQEQAELDAKRKK